MVEEMQVRKWIEELENELAEKNRFFPDGKALKLVDKLVDAPHKVLEKGTKIFRARTIDKYHEQQYFSSLRNDINRIISVHIPDFDINNGNYALMNLAEYVQKNNIKNIFDTQLFELQILSRWICRFRNSLLYHVHKAVGALDRICKFIICCRNKLSIF